MSWLRHPSPRIGLRRRHPGVRPTCRGSGSTPVAAQTVPQTPWGRPDLQGIYDYWTFTPLERPAEFADRDVLTAEEAAVAAQQRKAAALARDVPPPPGSVASVGAYSQAVWTDRTRATALTQPSLLVDPPDGKLPPLTPQAQHRAEAHRAAGWHPVRLRVGGVNADGPEARGVSERCIVGFSTGPPMLPGGNNNIVQLFQTPGYIVILHEMIHDARIIPLDGHAPLPTSIRQWLGTSRGHWEGNTLVVDTTNFTDKTGSFSTSFPDFVSLGSAERLHLRERLTRVDSETVMYEFTVEDPATFARPLTGRFPLNRTDTPVYEFACHEGNRGMFNMLSGARAEERATDSNP